MRFGGVGEMRVLEKSGKIPDFVLGENNNGKPGKAKSVKRHASDKRRKHDFGHYRRWGITNYAMVSEEVMISESVGYRVLQLLR